MNNMAELITVAKYWREWENPITLTQAKHFMSTLLHGDPQEGSVIVGAAKELFSSLLPGHRK